MDYFKYQKAVYDSTLGYKAKAVALAIASHYNWSEGKAAFPSNDTLADETGLSARGVGRGKQELADHGWVILDHRHNNSCLYVPAIGFNHGDDCPCVDAELARLTRQAEKVASQSDQAPSQSDQVASQVDQEASQSGQGGWSDGPTNKETNKEDNKEPNHEENKEGATATHCPFASPTSDSPFVPNGLAVDGDVPSPNTAVKDDEEDEEVIWGWTEASVKTLLRQKAWQSDDISRALINWKYDHQEFDGDGDLLERILREGLENKEW